MNKRGTLADVGLAMIFVFAAAVIFFTTTYVFNEFEADWSNNTLVNSSSAAVSTVSDVKDLANTRLDYVVFVILIGLTLAIIVTGWLVGGNPIFAWIYFIVLVIFVAVSSVLSYTWNELSNKAIFGTLAADSFPITDFILQNFPSIMAVIGFIGMIVMFAKPSD